MLERKQSPVQGPTGTPPPITSPGLGRVSSSSEVKSSGEWKAMHPLRISVADLKVQIVKRVGSDRAASYFTHFCNFMGSYLSKQELDKLVSVTLGRENVALHNQLVRAILTNAVLSQTPPPLPFQDSRTFQCKRLCNDAPTQGSPSCLSNGDSVLSSPRLGRSCRFQDEVDRLSSLELDRPLKQHHDVDSNVGLMTLAKRQRISHPTLADSASVSNSGASGIEENACLKECSRSESLQSAQAFIRAPLGIPFHSRLASTARRPAWQAFPAHLLQQDVRDEDVADAAMLPDREAIHGHMKQIAAVEGLEYVEQGCASVLKHALDAFLGRLIMACVDVVGPRQSSDLHQPFWDDGNIRGRHTASVKSTRAINGVLPVFAGDPSTKDPEGRKSPISLMDFKMGMTVDPQQLGENWPVQLEKISFRIFDQ